MQIKSQIHYRFRIGFRYAAIIICALSSVYGSAAWAGRKEILSSADVQAYREVYKAQQAGDYVSADALFQKIKNPLLAGYVLSDKFFSPQYRTKAAEIENWFKLYGTLPVSNRMRGLGKLKGAKLPSDVLKKSGSVKCNSVHREEAVDLIRRRTFSELKEPKKSHARSQFQKLLTALYEGKTLAVKNQIESAAFQADLPPADRALARTALAFSYFLDGEYTFGEKQIQTALRSDSSAQPLTYYIGGLIEWQLKNYKKAAAYFSKAAQQKAAYPLIHAASSLWAARTYLKTGEYQKVGIYLEAAAQHPDTFYGMLALHMLGLDLNTAWSVTAVDKTLDTDLQAAVDRFYALQQLGRKKEAVEELKSAFHSASGGNKKVLLNIAEDYQIKPKQLGAARLALIDREDYPLPNWKPDNGWIVNKALIYAFVRQESCFNSRALSVMGAKGVMQIMPATAKIMAYKNHLPWKPGKLENIGYNLALGQEYVRYLLALPAVNDNIIFMIAAYNSGPANLIKWKKKGLNSDDPLIFIEQIPSRETRAFVERILSNFWVYQSLLNQENRTVDQIIQGKWPLAGRIIPKKKRK